MKTLRVTLLAMFLGCGSVSPSAPDAGAGGAGGSAGAGDGRAGDTGGGGTGAAAGAPAGAGGAAGNPNHLGVCNGLPQPDDRYDNLHRCPAGTVKGSDSGGTLTDAMNRTLYPCALCNATACVLCRNDSDGGTMAQSYWCVATAADMTAYGTCR